MNKFESEIEEVGSGAVSVARAIMHLWLMGALIGLAIWVVKSAIHSWRVKDEMYRLDCIGIPIAGAIFVVSCAAIVIGMILFPDWR